MELLDLDQMTLKKWMYMFQFGVKPRVWEPLKEAEIRNCKYFHGWSSGGAAVPRVPTENWARVLQIWSSVFQT